MTCLKNDQFFKKKTFNFSKTFVYLVFWNSLLICYFFPDSSGGGGSVTNHLAITSLLQRFKDVLVQAIDGEKLNKNIPLQRQKASEISFVLKAIGTVISSMKRASKQSASQQDGSTAGELNTTLQQSIMNTKLCQQRFWHCHENKLIKTIKTIPHNL